MTTITYKFGTIVIKEDSKGQVNIRINPGKNKRKNLNKFTFIMVNGGKAGITEQNLDFNCGELCDYFCDRIEESKFSEE